MRIAIANLKGGVGKSTLTMFLAEYLAAYEKKRVLVIDLDPQSNCSYMLMSSRGVELAEKTGRTLLHLLGAMQEKSPKEIDSYISTNVSNISELRSNSAGQIDILPSVPRLWFVEMHLQKFFYCSNKEPSEEFNNWLLTNLRSVERYYDLVLIDCAPGFSSLTRSGLMIAESVISPTLADEVSVRSLKDFVKYGLEGILGIYSKDRHHVVISKYSNTKAERNIVDLLKNRYDVLLPPVRQTVTMAQAGYFIAPEHNQAFNNKYDRAASDVRKLSNEIYRVVYKAR